MFISRSAESLSSASESSAYVDNLFGFDFVADGLYRIVISSSSMVRTKPPCRLVVL